ncbi:condensin subunit Smc [Acinetobacter calcoaceticus]|uniref:Chromosome partition protein Smc n=1 Tax=Acinetobacter calcoaceticus TaxID=471 RepID=A0A4R1XVP2_ACICA|nr:condensin subunit Smc [Acinetobacter calcoaceticus]
MRLSSLKLSGFKSFADSTTLSFRSNRTAVVGPNGCGKSNVIDAIRWVMGESSARQLRGGNMQDVIFTGTTKRKPVGMASVELRFENTYGKLGGAYNAYSELAVRRQVSREGKSEYFLNGTKCRRRDITDIFLGTGLGPRSYAIIEQGMINRLVDAKPEEMRVFIEEAAGVSRYQARRRETLQHLEHTASNLERLEDIASELNAQLKTLKRQSETAVQYKTLEGEIRGLKIDILSYQCEQSSHLQQHYNAEMTTLGEQFKLVRTEMTTVEHDLSGTNELFQRLIQQSSPLQIEWQQAEKKLAELKLNLEQKQGLMQQNSSSLSRLDLQKTETKERLQLIELQLDVVLEQQQQQSDQLLETESSAQQQQQQLQVLNTQQQQITQQFELIKAQVEKQQQQQLHMHSQSEQLAKNILRIEQQKATLDQQLQQIQQQSQQDDVVQFEQDKLQCQQQLEEMEQQHQAQLTQMEQTQQGLSQGRSQLSQLQAELKVLLSEQSTLQQMLTKGSQASAGSTQLLQSLQLNTAGKAHASLIEKFLAKWLAANVLDTEAAFQPETARQLKVSQVATALKSTGLKNLSDWIETPQHSLWDQVLLVDTLTQALDAQAQLQVGQSILSLDGYHVGADWVIGLDYDESSQAAQGALSHRVRLDEIQQQLQHLQPQLPEAEQAVAALLQQQQELQTSTQQLQQQLKSSQQRLQQLDVDIVKRQSAAQAFALQQQHLQDQISQLDLQLEEDAMQKDDLEIDLHALMIKLDLNLPQYKDMQQQLDQLTNQRDDQQGQLHLKQQDLETTRRVTVQNQQQIELLEKDQSFLKLQYQQILAQIDQAKQMLDPIQLELPSLESQFNQQLQVAEKLQHTWNTWQIELNHVQEKQQQLTGLRHELQQQDEKLRTALEQQRLAWQAAKSDLQHYSEQLKALDSELRSGVVIDLAQHQLKLDKAQQQFAKLGSVNLAASDEYLEVSQRHAELTHQIEDLENTVAQLKDAMKTIDQETKKLFMTTFDRVNVELQDLFPKVFNGGEAQLSLEGDWQSGVKLMARPPGKRNSSLALLSGGEKALTALALVFAIFRLNPAPFCVLDEVDAPLDDANVGRFCNLVKELSEHVQFIYITHNKVAMTMATDLLGVTMPEPGASKLVSVNLEEAREYGLVAEL